MDEQVEALIKLGLITREDAIKALTPTKGTCEEDDVPPVKYLSIDYWNTPDYRDIEVLGSFGAEYMEDSEIAYDLDDYLLKEDLYGAYLIIVEVKASYHQCGNPIDGMDWDVEYAYEILYKKDVS